MKLRDYSNPYESQINTTSTSLLDNVSFRIDCHMLQLLPICCGSFMKSPVIFLKKLMIFA